MRRLGPAILVVLAAVGVVGLRSFWLDYQERQLLAQGLYQF